MLLLFAEHACQPGFPWEHKAVGASFVNFYSVVGAENHILAKTVAYLGKHSATILD